MERNGYYYQVWRTYTCLCAMVDHTAANCSSTTSIDAIARDLLKIKSHASCLHNKWTMLTLYTPCSHVGWYSFDGINTLHVYMHACISKQKEIVYKFKFPYTHLWAIFIIVCTDQPWKSYCQMYIGTKPQACRACTPKVCEVLDYQLCMDVGHVAAQMHTCIQAAEKYKFRN